MSIFRNKQFYIAFILTLIASLLGKYAATLPYLKVIGAMVIALIIGMLYQLIPGVTTNNKEGISFISGKFLRLGILLLGFKLNLNLLIETGVKTILLAIFVVSFMIFLTYYVCKAFKVDTNTSLLSACGCGICGAAAVMGVSPQIHAKNSEAVLSVAVVCIMGTVFTIITVLLDEFLGLSNYQYGVLCGATLHEIAHTVAAATPRGEIALDIAIIMKLSRVLLLAPVAFIVGHRYHKKHRDDNTHAKLPIPWFMVGFLATSIIGSFLSLPGNLLEYLVSLAYILLGMAMAALGMNVDFKTIKERGHRVLSAAFITSLILFGTVYLIVRFLF